MTAALKNYDNMLNACNTCHQATEHGFINIAKNPNNPYLQSFKPVVQSKK